MTVVHVGGIGIAAPGLPNWHEGARVLTGEAEYCDTDLPPYQPLRLPANERRRASQIVRLAFRAAEDAVQSASLPVSELAAVFATADADLVITSRICSALAESPRVVSPTDFHNSVQNAAAGYWSIATGARKPSTTVAGHDFSFAVGLLEAAALVHVDRLDTLLVAVDAPAPEPLGEKRRVLKPVALALLLTAKAAASTIARLEIELGGAQESTMTSQALEALRVSNPAARALPLLELLARGMSGLLGVARSTDQWIRIRVEPA